MRVQALLLLPLVCIASTQSQGQPADTSCRANLKEFYDAPAIATLPPMQRDAVIQTVLPDLKASQAGMGYENSDLTAQRLATLLRYTQLATPSREEQILAVTYQNSSGCGHHGQCSTYLLSMDQGGAHSLVSKRPDFGESVGGAWGAAVLSRKKSAYPDLLFLATISSSEIAVGCYRRQHTLYHPGCNVPCVHALAHPESE